MMIRFRSFAMMQSRNLIWATLCAYTCAFSFGLVIGYSSPALPSLINDGILHKMRSGLFGSVMTIGALVGCPIAGWCVQVYGRKASLFLTNVPYIIGWAMMFMTSTEWILIAARLVTGVASGMSVVAAPLYIAEIVPKESRGLLGSAVQLAITVGIFVAYFLGMYLNWRQLAAVAVLSPILGSVMTTKIYDTPRFYLLRNEKRRAVESIRWLRGPACDAEEECLDISENLDADTSVSWRDFTQPQLLNPLKVAVGLCLFQQLSGINVVMFYTSSIMERAGLAGDSNTAILGLVQVIFTAVACAFMDSAGRRRLLVISGSAMGLCMFLLGVYFQQSSGAADVSAALKGLAVLCLLGYTVAFSLGWGPIPMLVTAEVFPVKARGIASSAASATSWLSAFVITYLFPEVQAALGSHTTFWLFGGLCWVSVAFVIFNVPETKGKSLEDIELYFLGRAQVFQAV